MPGAIDYWCNPFTPEMRHQGFIEDPEMHDLVRWWRMEDRIKGLSPKDFVAMMDRTGMDVVIVPAFRMKSFKRKKLMWDFSVEEMAEAVGAYPNRLKGLYGINPEMRMEGVKELEKAVTKYGFIGAHLHTYGFELYLNDREDYPFYAKCAELGVPVVMQVGHSAEFLPSKYAQPVLVDDIALYFPELKIVASHTGWPWVEETIAAAWKHPNVYIGTAGHHPKYLDPSLVRFMNTRGIGKVMFGSTHPVVLYENALPAIAGLNLKDKARDEYLFGAARKVFKL